MEAVDVNPRPWSGRSNPVSNVSERGRRWVSDIARRTQRPQPAHSMGHGITVNGLSEPNVTVLVTLAGQALSVPSDDIGQWSASFADIQVPAGTIEIPVKAMTTDASGQTTTAEGIVQVET